MIVTILSHDRMRSVALPAGAAGGHWLEDASGGRVAFAEGAGGRWRISLAKGLCVRGAKDAKRAFEVDLGTYAVMNVGRVDAGSTMSMAALNGTSADSLPVGQSIGAPEDPDGHWSLIFNPESAGARQSQVFGFTGETSFGVGREADNAIVYPLSFVSAHHASFSYVSGSWEVTDLSSANGVFVNGVRIEPNLAYELRFGDIVSILDLTIALGRGLFSCNNPGGKVKVSPDFVRYRAERPQPRDDEPEPEREYFYPALRFPRAIEPKTFVVDAPPQPEPQDETSLAMRIGPSLVMAMASVMSASVSVSTLAESGGSMLRALPMCAMAVAMLLGSVLWPVLSARSQRKARATKEARRKASYSQYLGRVLAQISDEEVLQHDILIENRISVTDCLARAYTGDVRLMDRTSLHHDYLELRIGMGDESLDASLKFPERHFSLEDDEVRRAVDEMASAPRVLHEVPLAYSLIDKPVLGIIGEPSRTRSFMRGMVVQLAALHSYADVKLMLLADEAERDEWAFMLHLPHCFSNDRSMRYVAFGLEDAAELGMFMERELAARREANERIEAREQSPYYIVLCASEELAAKAELVGSAVAGQRAGLGVALVACAREMRDLPKECRSVIGLEGGGAYLLDRDDPAGAKRGFTPDIGVTGEMARGFAFALGKVRLDVASERSEMPAQLGFLEMEHVGSVEHLSIAQRWGESNAAATLACPVGVDAQGDPFVLNLHERFHGPHGLIAGTTGSGKSEFIITWILSMAANYSPNDVAFVLIDYKGGGLAKAFDNEHVRLPHLAGVITNLDGAAIKRSLVSIQSELRRRQQLFNHARNIAGGDNVDIYDYLDLFRQGRVSEPCPHLFIVADEFAELKQQEPDFMDELISAARIGRSLGVHLVLATQKPSGVVNDQIWSNARFKVCLKVSDEADSREMIKRPDAAALTQAGRFYLLVGYNEHFALGQAAYAGTRYDPSERWHARRDESVALVGDTGRQLVSVKPRRGSSGGDGRPESVMVLQRLQQTAKELGMEARQLWLEPVPAMVTLDGLARKYGPSAAGSSGDGAASGGQGFVPELAPIIGELDDPEHQRQGALALPISREGSTLVYGTAESGVELVLCAALHGLVSNLGPADLNVYALDFGTESLRAFANAPQVGDIICASDDERVMRFFDFIEAEQARRRTLLAECGGSFERYRATGGSLPAILVIVNDIAAVLEAYPKLEDRMLRFVRDAGRSGIYLVMTADGTGSVRIRMRQTFRQLLAVNLADASDYSMIFGMMRGLPIPKGLGRGLVKTEEGIFEFQAAHLGESGDDYALAQRLATNLGEQASALGVKVAPPVPTVPEHVTSELLLARLAVEGGPDAPAGGAATLLPFGIYEDSLGLAAFDFEEVAMARVVFQRRKSGAAFARALVATAAGLPGCELTVLDVAQLLGASKPQGCAFATRKAELAATHLGELLSDAATTGAATHLVIASGISALVSALPFDKQGALKGQLQHLSLAGNVRVLLVDALADVTYGYEDWFKAQLTSKTGLWVGPGLDGQSSISTNYTPGLVPDTEMRAARGYHVDGGVPRLVRLVGGGESADQA